MEEFISNAVYHKSYQIHEPITIRIESDKIEITSLPGPDRSISNQDIKDYNMRTRRYRNRRIGDFLKELHLVEGRNTGIPTALKSIKENKSPLPQLLTDEDRTYFTVVVPIHEAFKIDKNEKKTIKKRRTKKEIKKLILKQLSNQDFSANSLYKEMGYSGRTSKTFRKCIEELIEEGEIAYLDDRKSASTNVLTKK